MELSILFATVINLILLFLIFKGIVFLFKLFYSRKRREVADIDSSLDTAVKKGPTRYSKALYNSLKARGIEAKLEHWDGHKSVDIAILPAKLYIEVDGIHHYLDSHIVVKDIMRDNYSNEAGFHTVHVSNSAIWYDLALIANTIAKLSKERESKNNHTAS